MENLKYYLSTIILVLFISVLVSINITPNDSMQIFGFFNSDLVSMFKLIGIIFVFCISVLFITLMIIVAFVKLFL